MSRLSYDHSTYVRGEVDAIFSSALDRAWCPLRNRDNCDFGDSGKGEKNQGLIAYQRLSAAAAAASACWRLHKRWRKYLPLRNARTVRREPFTLSPSLTLFVYRNLFPPSRITSLPEREISLLPSHECDGIYRTPRRFSLSTFIPCMKRA